MHPEPGLSLEAGLLSREEMDRELSRLAAWSRSRKIARGGKNKRQRYRSKGSDSNNGGRAGGPGNDGQVEGDEGDGGAGAGAGGGGDGGGGGGGDDGGDGGGGGGVAAVAGPTTISTTTTTNPAGEPPCVYEEAHFPWKLEFRRQRLRRRISGGEQATTSGWGGVDREGSGNEGARHHGGGAALRKVIYIFCVCYLSVIVEARKTGFLPSCPSNEMIRFS